MELARTLVHAQTSAESFGTGSFTTSSFTPPDNSLLVVRVAGTSESGAGVNGTNLTAANSSGLTLSSRVFSGAPPDWSFGSRVWTATVTTGASMTVTGGSGGANVHVYRVEVYAYTGYNASTPVGATATGTDADGNGAASISLSAAPATDSEVLVFTDVTLTAGNNAVTPGTGWSEIYDVAIADWHGFHAQSRTGSTSSTVSIDDLSTAGTPTAATIIALEIKAATVGGVTGRGRLIGGKLVGGNLLVRAL